MIYGATRIIRKYSIYQHFSTFLCFILLHRGEIRWATYGQIFFIFDVRVLMVVAFHGPYLVSAQIYKTKSPDASILGIILHKKFRCVQAMGYCNIKRFIKHLFLTLYTLFSVLIIAFYYITISIFHYAKPMPPPIFILTFKHISIYISYYTMTI